MVGTILFFVLAAIAVAAAIGMLISTNAVHAALFLVINFVCIALFYLGLNAPFLAMVQVTVYAGAIMVLFVFVIMLLGAERVEITSQLRWQVPGALVLSLLLIAVAVFVLFSPQVGVSLATPEPLGDISGPGAFGSPTQVGMVLFVDYLLPFQMVGLLLLVAMIGAVVLAKSQGQPRHADDSPVERPGASADIL